MDQRSNNKPKRIMNKQKKINFIRRMIQLICFFLLPGFFIQIYTSTKAIVMAFINSSFTLQTNSTDLVIVLSVLPLTMLLGRFFCGWMCALGSISDLLTFFRNQLKINEFKIEESLDKKLKLIKDVIFLFSVIFIWTLQIVTIPQGINPLDAFGVLVSFDNLDLLFSSFLIATILLAAILAVSFYVPRFFCKYLCPTGAILSLISLPRMLAIKKPREICRSCTLCTKNCPMSIPLYQTDKSRSGECIECGQCVISCPLDNCHMQMMETEVNSKTIAAVAVTSIIGLNYLGTITVEAADFHTNYKNVSNGSQANESSDEISNGKYKDGTYQGSAAGFKGFTTVEVSVENGLITDIELISTEDDLEFFNKAWNNVANAIIQTQATDVDAVSGATYSSQAIMSAAANALSETDGEETDSDTSAETASDSTDSNNSESESESITDSQQDSTPADEVLELADGTYQGSGTGYRGEMTVKVTVQDGKIIDIAEISNQDDYEFFNRAWDTVTGEIITEQTIAVDAVSGATYSSNGIMEAVADALSVEFENPNNSMEGGHGGHDGHGGYGGPGRH